ncbi:MAG TPA: hypothetical protein VF401_01285 [Candidatus Saccharimonadales bacterium]
MSTPTRKKPSRLRPLQIALGLAVAYILLLFVLPANKIAMHNYHLSSTQYHALAFIVLLPLLLIWLVAFYSYGKLEQYAELIQKTPEGSDFLQLARGVKWLAWGLVIPSLVGIILNSIANARHGFLSTALITVNYLSLIIPLIGFSLMRRGAQGLTDHAKIRLSMANMQILITIFVALGVIFCFFTFQHLNLHSLGSTDNPYYLPGWLLIVTLIVPYLYAWFSGLLAAYEIVLFSKEISGVFYRQAMRLIGGGMLGVIASSVGLQYLRSVSPRTGHLSLSSTLVIINIIYVLMAIGYVSISMGAAKLQKIEEV